MRVQAAEPIHGIQIGDVILKTHSPDKCAGQHCVVHNPSDHHMVDWPLNWRGDTLVMERICPHGIGHPDPDHMSYVRTVDPDAAKWSGVHGCDGCCWCWKDEEETE